MASTGNQRRDFGSFHVSNVTELLDHQTDSKVSNSPFKSAFSSQSQSIEFGAFTKKHLFHIDEVLTALSYQQNANQWNKYIEEQPLRFYDRELMPCLVDVTKRLAAFVHCEARDIALFPNATTATNTVLNSIGLKKDDVIFYLSIEYGAVKKQLNFVAQKYGAVLQQETIIFPEEKYLQQNFCKLLVQKVEESLPARLKLAVFDHIPSNTPFILPIKELSDCCKRKGGLVLIDGAHALGQIPLNLKNLDVDYYVTNCHKWLCAPKGCAFMYVRSSLQDKTHPLIISHGYGSGFNSEFIWSGLRDYTPFLTLPAVLKFYSDVGTDTIWNYNKTLLCYAASEMDTRLGMQPLVPLDYCGSMACLRLPQALHKPFNVIDYDAAEKIQNTFYFKYNIEIPVKAINSKLYIRLAIHIHNDVTDIAALCKAIEDMVEQSC